MLLEIGYIGRPHGLRGEAVVQLVTTEAERLAPGNTVECRGAPLVVESARAVPGGSNSRGSQWVVRFAGVTSREGAEGLTGAVLRAEPQDGAEGLWVHELIGARVYDQDGEDRGPVVAVEANPASDLLVLESGALVPLRFVVASEGGRVTVEVPSGLFDL